MPKVKAKSCFVKATVHSQGEREYTNPEVETELRLQEFFLFMSAGYCIMDRVVSNGGYFQSFGGLPPQVGRGVSDPTRYLPKLSWQPFCFGGGYNHNANVL